MEFPEGISLNQNSGIGSPFFTMQDLKEGKGKRASGRR